MKKYLILALVLVLTMCLLAGCRRMTEDETTGPHDNSSVGDSTAGSTPVPSITLPTVPESSGSTDASGNGQGGNGGSANGGSGTGTNGGSGNSAGGGTGSSGTAGGGV